MNKTTRAIIVAALAADETIPQDLADAAMKLLDGKAAAAEPGRVIRTVEAAKLCGVTTKTLRAWAKAGALVPVYAPGNKCRTGYTLASVLAFVEGRAASPATVAQQGRGTK